MKSQILDDFIQYAKEQFGINIVIKETSSPDTFDKIFGTGYLRQDVDFCMPEGKDVVLEYTNNNTRISIDFNKVMDDGYSVQEMGLAA